MGESMASGTGGRMTRIVAVLLFAAASVSLSSCSSSVDEYDPFDPASTREFAASKGYEESVVALEDGIITREEWRQLHNEMRACFGEFGYVLGPSALDPLNGREYVFAFEYTPPDLTVGAADGCYSRYELVGQIYYATAEPRMDPGLLAAVRNCLESEGWTTTGEEVSFKDFFDVEARTNLDPRQISDSLVTDCVMSEGARLFPGVSINPSF